MGPVKPLPQHLPVAPAVGGAAVDSGAAAGENAAHARVIRWACSVASVSFMSSSTESSLRPTPQAAAKLLKLLKQNPTAYHLPTDLAEQLGISRNALFEVVEHLNGAGYSIEFHPYLGFRLADLPAHFLAEEVLADLNTRLVPKRVLTFDSVGSTLDAAWELAEQGEADGALALAEEQRRGRGRLGKGWFAPRGKGMYGALLLRPSDRSETPSPEMLAHLGMAAAVCLAHTINDIVHVPATVRWPNDVMIGPKKVGQVLVETNPDIPGAVVDGFNVNTHMQVSDLPAELREIATSLRIEDGGIFNHNRLVRYFLFYFDQFYQKLKRGKLRPVADALKEYDGLLRKELLVLDAAGEHRGMAKAIDPYRLTLVPTAEGQGANLVLEADKVLRVRVIQ